MANYPPQPPYPTGSQSLFPQMGSRANSYEQMPSPYEQPLNPFPHCNPQQHAPPPTFPQQHQQQVPNQPRSQPAPAPMYQAPSYGPTQGPYNPQPAMQPAYPNVPMGSYPLGEPNSSVLRPGADPRRLSQSSHRSNRSNISRHSRRSKHSSKYDSDSDSDDDDNDDYDYDNEKHGHHHNHHHKKHHHSSKNIDARPTIGGSMFAAFDTVKDAMFGKKS